VLNYAVLSKKPEHFRNFSGLTLQEFDTINQVLNEKYVTHEQKRLTRTNRKRNIGAGHPFTLNLTDRLLMLLIYYKPYTSSTLLSYLFGISQTNVLKNIRIIEPIIRETLPLPNKEHAKIKK